MTDKDPEYDDLRSRVEYLSGENAKIFEKLAQMGVEIDKDQISQMRYEIAIDMMLGPIDSSVARLRFEERFHEALEKALSNTMKQAEQQVSEAEKQKRLSRLRVPGQPQANNHKGRGR